MKESYLKGFNAIVEFVNDLWEVFGNPKKATPLALYRRLTQHIKFTDEEAILKAIRPFKRFVTANKDIILSGDLNKIARGITIPYGTSKICIEIQKFIYQGDSDTNIIIHQHLLAISAIFCPDEKTIEELEKKLKDGPSPESDLINNVINKLGPIMSGVDTKNPMAAISQLASSGIMGDLIGNMTQGLSSGEMDISKLFGSLQSTFETMSKASIEEIDDEKPTIDEKPEAKIEELD